MGEGLPLFTHQVSTDSENQGQNQGSLEPSSPFRTHCAKQVSLLLLSALSSARGQGGGELGPQGQIPHGCIYTSC